MAKAKAKQAKNKAKPDTAYLTKRGLIRAINKGTRSLSEEALKIKGRILTVEDGWVVKKDRSGRRERISKLPARPSKIILD